MKKCCKIDPRLWDELDKLHDIARVCDVIAIDASLDVPNDIKIEWDEFTVNYIGKLENTIKEIAKRARDVNRVEELLLKEGIQSRLVFVDEGGQ